MIRTLMHNRNTGETHRGGEALIADYLDNPDTWLWVDVDREDLAKERHLLQHTLGFHQLVVDDAQRERHPPKLELFDDYFFLLVAGLSADTTGGDYKNIQISCFVGERLVVTRRAAESVSIDGVWSEGEQGLVDFSRGPAYVAYRVLRRVTDRYTRLVEGMEHELDNLEDEMFLNPRDELLEDLIGYGRNLKRLRRTFNYQQGLLLRLTRKDHPFICKRDRHEFNDVFEHTERVASLVGLYKELVDDLMNGYISVASHRLNQIMKVLTIVTVVFAPLALLVGVYGMNFEYIPELKARYGYFIFLGVMASIVASLLLFFKKIRWL